MRPSVLVLLLVAVLGATVVWVATRDGRPDGSTPVPRAQVGTDGKDVVALHGAPPHVATPGKPAHAGGSTDEEAGWPVAEQSSPVLLRGTLAVEGATEGERLARPIRIEVEPQTPTEGSFVAPSAKTVDLACPGPFEIDVTHPLAWMQQHQVSEHLTLSADVPCAFLDLRVTAEGSPAFPERVWISDVGMAPEIDVLMQEGEHVLWGTHFGELDPRGRLRLGLSPGGHYSIWIEGERYETWTHDFFALSSGRTSEVVAELEPRRIRPRLIVRLEGDGALGIKTAAFGFWQVGEAPRSSTPWPMRNVEIEDGRFVLKDLTAGTYRLHVRPGRHWYDDPAEWAEAVVDVEVPPEGEAHVRIPVEKGGRLRISAVDVHGRHLPAACWIVAPTGEVVPAWFMARDSEGNGIITAGTLPEDGPAWVEPVLVPGEYLITIDLEGYRPSTIRVGLEAGQPEDHRVVLEKEE